jgi:hypothetical protein
MKCSVFFCLMMGTTSAFGIDWNRLSKLNDPPGRPTVRAAKVATQGMHPIQMQTKIVQFRRALRDTKVAKPGDSTARSVLRREIALLEVALENK